MSEIPLRTRIQTICTGRGIDIDKIVMPGQQPTYDSLPTWLREALAAGEDVPALAAEATPEPAPVEVPVETPPEAPPVEPAPPIEEPTPEPPPPPPAKGKHK